MSRRFRVGTTSYIIPDDIIPNVEYLGPLVDDVEMLLFEIEPGRGNLPSAHDVRRLRELADRHALGYTIHMPLDVELGAAGEAGRQSLRKALSVIACTRPLTPRAWVLHLEGRDVLDSRTSYREWSKRIVAALEALSEAAGAASRLVVENLEGYPLDFLDPVLESAPVSRCVDIGHLWVDGHDPMPYLRRHLARTRVVHLHGIGTRDHQSLAHVPAERLREIVKLLESRDYRGVVTIEVFSESDLASSLAALDDASRLPAGRVDARR